MAGCGVSGRGEWREESWVVALEKASSVKETEQIPESRGAEARLGKTFPQRGPLGPRVEKARGTLVWGRGWEAGPE